MRSFKKRETKTSFIVATFSIDFLSIMSFLTRTKISFFFFFIMRLRRKLFFFRENLIVVFILETRNLVVSFDCRRNAFSSSSLFSSKRKNHIRITITLRVACCSCDDSFLLVIRSMSFKIEKFITML